MSPRELQTEVSINSDWHFRGDGKLHSVITISITKLRPEDTNPKYKLEIAWDHKANVFRTHNGRPPVAVHYDSKDFIWYLQT